MGSLVSQCISLAISLGWTNRAVASPALVCRFAVLIKDLGCFSVRTDGKGSAAPDRGIATLEGGVQGAGAASLSGTLRETEQGTESP